ncbi:SDR family NAD(P)-dependent oxidoreductase, partial [Streptomyces buecherae]|uniref:type I polyketide synthase n=1 Tax=Streptomyces buecherae TaxID=2763006 RepID=UPI0033EEDFBA
MHASSATSGSADRRIAVVGLACRVPGASDPAAFWRLLRAGTDAVTEAPAGRHTAGHARGGFLAAVDEFDPGFFGMSPREAAAADPQQRLALELCWEALEDARVRPERLRGSSTGVFIGAMSDDYATLQHAEGALSPHSMTGLSRAVIANRLSYLLGLSGPSLAVDSAQSSSLAAVHLAVRSLLSGESTTAIAGGVHLNLAAGEFTSAELFGALSPDGRCRVFDAGANGFVRGEGGGIVVLKPLSAAVADGDTVHAVILGSALGSGAGHTLTTPVASAQEAVLRAAHARAGVAPDEVQYVELHGTGTPVGDPVEAAALGAALGRARPVGQPLAVGSVKTNIGHLEGAAGIAGLIKVVLSVRHRELPPSLHFDHPHPRIPLDELNVTVRRHAGAWPRPDAPLVAGVSSFGMGGTNCHVVLSDWRPEPATGGEDAREPDAGSTKAGGGWPRTGAGDALPWLVSARGAAALRAQAAQLVARVTADPGLDLADLAGSLATSRTSFEHRAVVLGSDRDALLAGLAALAEGREAEHVRRGVAHRDTAGSAPVGTAPAEATDVTAFGPGALAADVPATPTAFVFTGQGEHRPGLGRAWYAAFPVFAAAFDAVCAALARPLADATAGGADAPLPLGRVALAEPGTAEAALVDRPEYAQPALFAVEVALFRLLTHWGVRPDVLAGHGVGHLAAAHCAGVLDLSDACALVAARAAAAGPADATATVTVEATADEATVSLAEQGVADAVALSAVPGPGQVVLSGAADAVRRVATAWAARGRTVAHLPYDGHPAASGLAAYRARAAEVTPRPPRVPLLRATTGTPLTADELADPATWVRQAHSPAHLAEWVRALRADGVGVRVEIGPGTALGTAPHAGPPETGTTLVPTWGERGGEVSTIVAALAELHVRGVHVDWDVAFAGTRQVALPTYAFQRARHWFAADTDASPLAEAEPRPAATPRDATSADGDAENRATGSHATGDLVELVRAHTAAVLGYADVDAVDVGWAFRDLGLDSYGSTELCLRLSRATGVEVTPTALFNHPTPTALAGRLRALLDGAASGAEAGSSSDVAGPRRAADDEPIAIVGMGCRFPGGVGSPEELWRLVREGRSAIGPFPTDRGWDLTGLYDGDPGRPGTSYAREGGFLSDVAGFDAEFFGISPREALAMDPQQRLLLETSWEAFERAGINPGHLRGSRTGVFVGATSPDYGPRMHEAGDGPGGYVLTGTTPSVASGRLAYVFGLEGPAVTVDTACSSSLVALHLAVRSLRAGESDLALASGVTVLSTPGMFVEFSRQRGLAPDGRCKPFAAAADGTSWAEGVGVLVVERLSDARRNGHQVLALVRGTAVNQDGASNGLTAPHGPSQERLIHAALADSGLTAGDVDAVEAHGTGTRLGDPIEAEALLATYGRERPADRPVWLGSVKSNLGHTQAAAGMAGVIKMVQAMRHGRLPATLHVDEPTPRVAWNAGAVALLTEAREWPDDGRTRRAAVSAFGVSGTNAHVILEQAAEPAPGPSAGGDAQGPVTVSLSARRGAALRAYAERLHAHLVAEPDLPVHAVAATLAARSRFDHRAEIVASDRAELLAGLAALASGEQPADVVRGVAQPGRTVFVFPGQGSQWIGMGAGLLRTAPVFARSIDACSAALAPHVGWDLRTVLTSTDPHTLDRVEVVQPATWAVMVSLARWWQEQGVTPDAVIGHSQGEIAAAHIAGALTLEDAARIVALRSQAITALAGSGGMMSVATTAEQAGELIAPYADDLHLAALNGPTSVVVAGRTTALDQLQLHCAEREIRHRRIPVDYASHTPHIAPIEPRLAELLATTAPRAARVPFYSTVHAEPVDTTTLTADYWITNLRSQVRFEPTVRRLLADGHTQFIECSPHPGLTTAIEEAIDAADARATTHPTLLRDDDSPTRLQHALAHARAHTQAPGGHRAGPRPAALPTYPFQHQRFWLAPSLGKDRADAGGHRFLGGVVPLAETGGALFTGTLSLAAHPWLADHAVGGVVLLPGAAMVELALHAAEQVGCNTVEELTLSDPLPVPAAGALRLQLTVGAAGADGRRSITLHARATDAPGEDAQPPWTRHADGVLAPATTDTPGHSAPAGATWPPTDAQPIDIADAYPGLAAAGYAYGPAFQGLRALWRRGDELFAEVALDGDGERADASADPTSGEGFGIHPAALDAALHAALVAGPGVTSDAPRTLLPFAWSGVRLQATGATALRVRISPAGQDAVSVDLTDPRGDAVARVDRLVLRPVPPERLRALAAARPDGLYRTEWIAPSHPVARADTPGERPAPWALLGAPDLGAGLDLRGLGLPDHATLGDLAAAWADAAPAVVIAPMATAEPGADTARVGVQRALELVQEWLADERFTGSRLAVVTRGAVATDPTDAVRDLAGAALWGLVRAAETENPGRFVLMDVDAEPASLAALPAALATGEPQLALRAGRLALPRLTHQPIQPVESAAPTPPAAWNPDGTVLITGGSGSLGALLARHLVAEHGVRHLLLASRRGPHAPGAAELREELAAHGADVTLAARDLAEPGAAEDLVAAVPSEHPLTAVLHLAGVLDDGLVTALTPERLHRVLAPKVDAAWRLHQATLALPLDAFVLFSSVAGVLGLAGQANYAAANAFLDGLAAHRRALGLPGQSLAWGLWADASDMTRHLAAADVSRMARAGLVGLSAAEGLALFDAATRTDAAHLVAARLSPAAYAARSAGATVPAVLRGLVREPVRRAAELPAGRSGDGGDGFATRIAGLPPAERSRAALRLVREQVAAVLGHASSELVDTATAFKKLGFDSLTGVELRNRLADAVGRRLPTTLVFDYPTPDALAAYLLGDATSGETDTASARRAPVVSGAAEDDPVVIVGMACRYPGGVASPEDLWQLVADGRDGISDFPTDRGWDLDTLFHPDPDHPGTSTTRYGNFLHTAGDFDAALFGISPREALAMDPQQRLLLETAWETFERTGIDPTSLRGSRTGVFAGVMYHDYANGVVPEAAGVEGHVLTGTHGSVASGRLSYVFGLEGPAVTVDTACSSSLVALHLAAQSLRTGECDLALAGGVTIMSSPGTFIE